ncbi:hypothetical protein C8035_v003952 [Colletotrichum spinosum]|uniref:Nad dependent epimerase dehydratase n=1 Tax=Colletotrichum spinosum TaxID=1347390 RepID=A0A4R8PSY4_9PEZI|nr:hypothetical protein C8035_v003952 [Colletotrichum spinosum]
MVEAYKAKKMGGKERLHALLEDIFAGFVGCTDMPPIDFIPELLEIYPDAKVILTVRDPHRWAQSIKPVAKNTGLWWLPYLMWPVPGWRWFPTLMKEIGTCSRNVIAANDKYSDPYLGEFVLWSRSCSYGNLTGCSFDP